jgi:hypothetical protein
MSPDQELLNLEGAESESKTLFDELAGLVPAERQREYYRVIAHTRTLSPNDEMLRILEATGILALLTLETPAEIAAERKSLRKILEASASQANAVEKRMEEYTSLNHALPTCRKNWKQGWTRLELRSCRARVCDSVSSSPVCRIPPERLTSVVLK